STPRLVSLCLLLSFPTRRSSDLFIFSSLNPSIGVESIPIIAAAVNILPKAMYVCFADQSFKLRSLAKILRLSWKYLYCVLILFRSEEHTSELQSRFDLVCRLLLE